MKVLDPLEHGVIDYVAAGGMMLSPWMFGFSRNRRAKLNAIGSGAAILGLSLMTRYPLGVFKVISFPTHGVIETVAAMMTVAAPWTMGFSDDKSACRTHVLSGLGTLAVVAMTDYQAANALSDDQARRRQVAAQDLSRSVEWQLDEGRQEGVDVTSDREREMARPT
jgi:SPW repeat